MIDVLQISCSYALQEQADRHLGAAPHARSSQRRRFRRCLFEQHRYTTHTMERIMREVKRRTRVIGVFPNANSALRIIGSVALSVQEYWYNAKPLFSGNRNTWTEFSSPNTPENTGEETKLISQ